MALWDDHIAEVYKYTNKPKFMAETAMALRQGIRKAHRVGKFWRDIVTVSITNVPVEAVQVIPLGANFPNFRNAALVRSGTSDKQYDPIDFDNLLDPEGFVRTDVYWGIGDQLNIRSSSPEDSYRVSYYLMAGSTEEEYNADWLAQKYPDVPTLFAAITVLGQSGEAEIRKNLETLLALAISDLIADNTEFVGR